MSWMKKKGWKWLKRRCLPEGVNTGVTFRALAKKGERKKRERENEREKSLEMFFCGVAARVKVNAVKKKKKKF